MEHDEAVMLEAAMFGGIPEGAGYSFPYAPHQLLQSERPYSRPVPRPPSPSLTAQRLIREQQVCCAKKLTVCLVNEKTAPIIFYCFGAFRMMNI